MKKLILALTAVLMISGMAAASTGLDDCSGDFCAMDSGDDTDTQENDTTETPEDTEPENSGLLDALFSFLGDLFS